VPGPGEELITDPLDRETPQEDGWTLSYPHFEVHPARTHVFTLSGKGPGGGPLYISFKITITDAVYSHESELLEIINDDQYRGVSFEATLEGDWDPETTTIFITIIVPPDVPPFTFNMASLTYSFTPRPQYLPVMGIG